MKKFKLWLLKEKNNGLVPGNSVSLILDELSTHDNVSILIAGTFPLTYGLLATVRSQQALFIKVGIKFKKAKK